MLGIYFSGTGNSKRAAEVFCAEYDKSTRVLSIEDVGIIDAVKKEDELVFSYPVQYSTVPKILRDFITENKDLWNDKKVFVICTMGMFSGDGAGVLGRLLKKYGAKITGGLHLRMPDSICDEKALKKPFEKNRELVKTAEEKAVNAAKLYKEGKPTKEGINVFYRLAGFFGQRLYFGHMTKKYSDKLKIDKDVCIGCGKCEQLCPMRNIKIVDNKAVSQGQCTMCYRCVNHCPKQAITLLGKAVIEQTLIEKYN